MSMGGDKGKGDVPTDDDKPEEESGKVHDSVPPRPSQNFQSDEDVQLSKSRSRRSLILPKQHGGSYTPCTTASYGSLEPSPSGCDVTDVSPSSTSIHSPLPASCPRVRPTTALAESISGPIHEESRSNPRARTHFHEPSDVPPLSHGVSCPREACNLSDSSPAQAQEYDGKRSKPSEAGEKDRADHDIMDRMSKLAGTSMALDPTSPLTHLRQQDHDASAFDCVRTRGGGDALAATDPTTPVPPIIHEETAGAAFSVEAGNSGGLLRTRREIPPPSSPSGPWLSRRSGGRDVLPRFRRTIPEQTPPRHARAESSSRQGPGRSIGRRFSLFVPLWLRTRLRFLGRWPRRRAFRSCARRRQARDGGKERRGDETGSSCSRGSDGRDVRKAGESEWGAAARTSRFMDRFGNIRGLVVRACFFLLAASTMWYAGLTRAADLGMKTVQSPPLLDTLGAIIHALDIMSEQGEQYTDCLNRQNLVCQTEFMAHSLSATRQRKEIVDEARITDERAVARMKSCAVSVELSVASLRAWVSGGTGHKVFYSEACSDADKRVVHDLVGDVTYPREELALTTDGFLNYSAEVLDSLASYAVERTSYDMSYAANKTAPLTIDASDSLEPLLVPAAHAINKSFEKIEEVSDLLVSCVSPRGEENHTQCLQETAREMLDAATATLRSQLMDARMGFGDYAAAFSDFQAGVADANERMMMFYEGVMNSVDVRDLGEWARFTPGDFAIPHVSVPSAAGILWGYADVPTVAEVWGHVSDAYSEYLGGVEEARDSLLETSEWLLSEAKKSVANISVFELEDYHPPQYKSASSAEESTILLVATASEHARAVEAHRSRYPALLDDLGPSSANQSILLVGPEFSDCTSGEEDGDTDIYSGNDDDKEEEEESSAVKGLDKLRIAALYRILASPAVVNFIASSKFTLFLVSFVPFLFFYWDQTKPDLSNADTRFARHLVDAAGVASTLQNALLRFLCVEAIIYAWALVAFVLPFSAATTLFAFRYSDYREGCVLRTKEGGSKVTGLVYGWVLAQAKEKGDSMRQRLQAQHEEKEAMLCDSLTAELPGNLAERNVDLRHLHETHREHVSTAVLLRTCLDTEAMDIQFGEACCGLSGYGACTTEPTLVCPKYNDGGVATPFHRVGEELSDEDCSEETLELEDWQFEVEEGCPVAPVCHITCSAPNEELLKLTVMHATCMVEWTLLSSWLIFIIASSTFFLSHLSRGILIGALTRRHWRLIHAGVFTYEGTCEESGTLVIHKTAFSTGNAANGRDPLAPSRAKNPSGDANSKNETDPEGRAEQPWEQGARKEDEKDDEDQKHKLEYGNQDQDGDETHTRVRAASRQAPASRRDRVGDVGYSDHDPQVHQPSMHQPSMHQKVLSDAIKESIKRYEDGVCPQILFAIVLNLPWMMIIAFAKNIDLAYSGPQ